MVASLTPDLGDVLAAGQRIAPYLKPTPLYGYPALDALTGGGRHFGGIELVIPNGDGDGLVVRPGGRREGAEAPE